MNTSPPTRKPVHRTRLLARTVAVTVMALIAGMLGIVPATAAPAVVTSLTAVVTPVTFYTGATVSTELTFCLKDGASAGDDFTIVLSKYHEQLGGQVGQVKDFSVGPNVVAKGEIMNTNPYTIHVVLTDYVETHNNVCGAASVSSATNKTALDTDKPTTFTYTVEGQGVSAVAPVSPVTFVSVNAMKWGGFTYTDQGRDVLDKAIYWRFFSPAGPLTSWTLTDPAPPGQLFDCATIVTLYGDRVGDVLSNRTPYTGTMTVECTPSC